MTILIYAGIALAIAIAVLALSTRYLSRAVVNRFPPAGEFAELGGHCIHYIDMAAGPDPDLETMVFIHGAAGNARDLAGAFADTLAGRGRMLFVDRPGAGYSSRAGSRDAAPSVQADYVAGLMDRLGIGRAVIVGHSFGGAVAAAFAVHHPEKVGGLVFIAPATHPWHGNPLTWYYNLTNLLGIGHAFAHLVAVPFGHLLYKAALKAVFWPDRVPGDYGERSGTRLVLRPGNFFHNATDVGALKGHVEDLSPRYGEITVPTVIISGDQDHTVDADLHSRGLSRDLPHARMVWLEGRGHMPTYSATDEIVAEIEKLNAEISESRLESSGQIPERPSLAT